MLAGYGDIAVRPGFAEERIIEKNEIAAAISEPPADRFRQSLLELEFGDPRLSQYGLPANGLSVWVPKAMVVTA